MAMRAHRFEYFYFVTQHTDPRAHLIVTVESGNGDPDLFVSVAEKIAFPTSDDHTWRSTGKGDDRIEIRPTDFGFELGQYAIAVYGGSGGTVIDFQISVFAYRPLGGPGATMQGSYNHQDRTLCAEDALAQSHLVPPGLKWAHRVIRPC